MQKVTVEFVKHKDMSYEYYIDYSHPFDDWMWKMVDAYGEKIIIEFEKHAFEFPNYKSSYHVIDNCAMFAMPKNEKTKYYDVCISILERVLYEHPNIQVRKTAIDNLWAIKEHEILKKALPDNRLDEELRHQIHGYLIDKKLNEHVSDLKDKSNISTLVSYFHKHENNFIDAGLRNRNLECVINHFGVKKTATLLFEISNYKGAAHSLHQQIHNNIKHNTELYKQFLKVCC